MKLRANETPIAPETAPLPPEIAAATAPVNERIVESL